MGGNITHEQLIGFDLKASARIGVQSFHLVQQIPGWACLCLCSCSACSCSRLCSELAFVCVSVRVCTQTYCWVRVCVCVCLFAFVERCLRPTLNYSDDVAAEGDSCKSDSASQTDVGVFGCSTLDTCLWLLHSGMMGGSHPLLPFWHHGGTSVCSG